MPRAKLTSKGQITVPKPVREALGIHPGDRVNFRVREDGTITVEAETVDLRSLRGVLRPRVRGVSIEDMNDAIRLAGAGR
ncbi:MAG: AbrB/MazE/SpoVT family DNA-binding domain-containing protein [Gemmatimonadaceae bacterium]